MATSSENNLLKFLAYSKICSGTLSLDYVCKVNYGECGESALDTILLLRGYIKEVENYVYSCCENFLLDGIKHFQGENITMSTNNSLYLTSKEGKVEIKSSDLNCLTEEDICELASRIKKICINC